MKRLKTSKPISTIWWGDDEFLRFKLDDLVRRRILDFYAFIRHKPEEDEKKEHSHVFCIPSQRIDTNQLRDYLTQYDPNHPKPILPNPFRSSKYDDWEPYVLHDPVYLASKGQSRKFHYKFEEIQTSDENMLMELHHEVNWARFKTQDRVKAMAEQGISFTKIVADGIVPVQQINQYRTFYETVVEQYALSYRPKTNRNGNENHEEPDDDDLPF